MKPSNADPGRLRVGSLITPLAPYATVKASVLAGRALRVDDIWFGDHTRHFIPKSLWTPEMTPLARLCPSLNA